MPNEPLAPASWQWIEEIIVAIPVTLVFSAIVYFAVGLAGNFFVFWIIWLFTVFSCE